MIREFRLLVYFIVGLLLSSVSIIAFADRNCPPSVQKYMSEGQFFGDPASACAANSHGYSNISAVETSPGSWKCSQGIYGDARSYVLIVNLCDDLTYPDSRGMCECPGPCAKKSGLAVDDGSLDFGDGGNKKLSMSFPDRADGNYTGQSFCSGGCKAVVDKEVGSSGMTVEGYYYGQFSAKFSGLSCESGQAEVSTKTTPALIPKNSPEYDCVSKGMGFGFVNGAVKCVAKTSSKEKETKSSETTKADGSKTKETKTDNTVCTAGVCTTTTTTITTEYNSSGTVSGTSTKTDTVTKADPNSGLGSGGVKDYQPGTECGVSGKPPCGVKVDETGVSTDVSAMNQTALDKFTAVFDEVRQKMEEVTRPKVWGVSWNYTVPSGSCSILQYGVRSHQFSLDICKPLGFVRDLWSYVIYVMTGLYIWRSARDAMNVV